MTQPNLLDILARTPVWVFAVFFVLLALGYQQSRTRTVSRQRFLLLPVAMVALSLYGVASAFGVALVPLLAWVLGAGGVAVLGARCLPSSAQPVAPGVLRVQGSWWPLVLMMAIFATKYVIGYASARSLDVVVHPGFIGGVSLLLGMFSGVFAARALAAWGVFGARIRK